MRRFEGQTALVTGGAKGIGAATAERLASEGAHVVVADFDEAAATETAERIGGRAVRCDVTSRADVEGAVAAATETGRLDVLVTCAGIIRDNLVHKLTDDDWDAVIATHLRGSFLAAQAAQAQMTGQGAARWCSSRRPRRSATGARRTTRRRRPGSRG
ncbi:MAG: SDR family NAD(P)-dependent oxidoreductase [Gaiella sp.]|nr:SDR family NAD(P)-dependent oxidoreductase [Gaiella sp.]